MTRIVVLGGCGGIGRFAVRALASGPYFDEIVIADVRAEAAKAFAAELAGRRAVGVGVDAAQPASVHAVIKDASVVLNCIGPFYRFGPPLLRAAIDAHVKYVDVCDDLDPTVKMLDMDGAARDAGVPALVGMGNSPGLANLLVRFCADTLLDTVEGADIMHIHGGEPEEGAAVIKHRIHAMLNDVPLFIDGRLITVRQLEPSGQAYVREVDFPDVGRYPVYPYPHPETITLPRYLPTLRRATNLGVVFPLSYFHLTQDMVRVGTCTTEPLLVQGQPVVPIEFAVAHIIAERPRLLREAQIVGPAGCLQVQVDGKKDGAAHTYVFSMSSRSAGAGEGTGIPAAVAAVLLHRGEIDRRGVFPPEAAVPPLAAMSLASEMLRTLGVASGGDSIKLVHVGPDGTRKESALPI
ncbi:saccharopine dehydrogenase NADP-binding domain-containing protein [Candidatus Binatia bacterium]|nr:saccharopine dehydrogenase NADP-binding domain-containing protein [Candidatus Binatia bacterium]